MINLCLHCGSQSVNREQVDSTTTPTSTRTWTPIPHNRLLEQVESTLGGSGPSGERYFGLLEVANGQEDGDFGLVVGLRNSHDKSFPAAIVAGSGVFVCDNLSFHGEVNIARRHTRYIQRDLPRIVATAVGKLTDMRNGQDARIAGYKHTDLDARTVHDLVIRAIDARVVPPSRIPMLLEEWRRPRHREFTENGFTGWRLFNAFTEVLKGRNLAALPKRTKALHGLLDAACGIAV